MYVDPGELNKKIQIVQKLDGESYDDEGIPIKNEKVVRTCWARVSYTSGSELIRAGSELAEAKVRFLVRYTPVAVTTGMVVRYQGSEPVEALSDSEGQEVGDSDGHDILTDHATSLNDYSIVYVNPYGDSREYLEIWTQLGKREV